MSNPQTEDTQTEISTNPMDGAWVDKAARLYLSRYRSDQDGSPMPNRFLEQCRITNCIRECLPADSRNDETIPQIMRERLKLRTALEKIRGNDPEANRLHADEIASAALG